MHPICKKLQLHWNKPKNCIKDVEEKRSLTKVLENKYNLTLPECFKEYLIEIVPNEGRYNHDDDLIAWWSVRDINNIPDEYEYEVKNAIISKQSDKYLFFADYFIWSSAWAISCASDETYGKIVSIGDNDDAFVADSFEEFIDKYIHNHDAIMPVAGFLPTQE